MRMRAERLVPFAFVLPSIAFLAVLVLLPTLQTFLLSVTTASGGFTLDMFRHLFADLNFTETLRNTLLLLFIVVLLQVALALAMALLINSRFPGHTWFQYLCVLPLAVSDLAAGLIWLAALTDRGYLNSTLQSLGIIGQPVLWLSFDNPAGLLAAIVIAESWRTTAIVLFVLLGGLQLVPRELFDAAEVFGANRLRRVIHVLFPLLRPSLQSALVVRSILVLPTFAVVFVLAGRNMTVLAGEAYTWSAANHNDQVAAAYAAVILGLSLIGIIGYAGIVSRREAELEL